MINGKDQDALLVYQTALEKIIFDHTSVDYVTVEILDDYLRIDFGDNEGAYFDGFNMDYR
ncbi:MAG: hypothetical protein LBV33_02455 [Lachnospiraceae bacterium]|nr:hypothetical protein [Lachnospiraceae bacterium]